MAQKTKTQPVLPSYHTLQDPSQILSVQDFLQSEGIAESQKTPSLAGVFVSNSMYMLVN